MVPWLSRFRPRDQRRFVELRFVQARGADDKDLGPGGERHENRGAADRTKGRTLESASVAGHLPGGGLTDDLDRRCHEDHMRLVTRSTFALTLSTLTIDHGDRLARYLVTDFTAGASA